MLKTLMTSVFSVLTAAGACHAQTYSPDSLTAGVSADASRCASDASSVWVTVDGQGDCLRYYAAGLQQGANPRAVIYLHGDRLWGEKPISYDDADASQQTVRVEGVAKEIGMPFIMIARPGTYGSSGNHGNRRQMREVRLVAAAVEAIRQKHHIEQVGLTGQSGGGTNAAYVLSQDAKLTCVVLTSAALSMRTIVAADPKSIYDTTKPGLYNPIDHVDAVPKNASRPVWVIGADGDQFSPLSNQAEYAAALRQAGNTVYLEKGEPTGASRHTLDRTGRHVAAWCLQGVPFDEISRRVRSGEIKG